MFSRSRLLRDISLLLLTLCIWILDFGFWISKPGEFDAGIAEIAETNHQKPERAHIQVQERYDQSSAISAFERGCQSKLQNLNSKIR
jgi:hypothetical protein